MIYFGVVESRLDPLKLGRCKVRVTGIHTEDKFDLPTDDLPWAYPMQSIDSAAMSGIGRSPIGVVEGTWVVVQFADEYKQMPIVVGTVGGIPTKEIPTSNVSITESTITVTDSDNTPVVDSSGTPVVAIVQAPGNLTLSTKGIVFLQGEEKISSIVKGQNKYTSGVGLADNTPIYAYQDSKGVWTIGWGSTYLFDNSRVTSSTQLTKKQCDELFDVKLKEYIAGVNRNLKVQVTQSMFDALVSMAYNMGVGGLTNSAMFSALNAGRYEEATALIPSTRASGLANRRTAERNLFESEGFPGKDGSSVEKSPDQIIKEEKTKTTQTTSTSTSGGDGFKDPFGKYPVYIDEPDTNRLARHEAISKTIVKMKEIARATGIKTAQPKITWSQPLIPYNAKYPFNHTRVSESGHVEEWDDTKGNERTHKYHRSGTFEEIDVNGTKVCRIVGDSYEILERNGKVLIRGSLDITILGNANVRVENDANLQVLGNMNTNVTGDYKLAVGGDIQIRTDKKCQIMSKDLSSVQSENKVYLNSGKTFKLDIPTEKTPGLPEFQPLFVPTRKSVYDANYETPEEGDNAKFMSSNAPDMDSDNMTTPDTTSVEQTQVQPKPVISISTTCENLTDSDIVPSYKLSTLFKLSDVIKGASASPHGVPQGINFGLSASEIVCNLKKLSINCLDVIKAEYPNMIITNTWRSEAVNTRIGGSKTSDHLTGCAADIVLSGFTRKQHYDAIIAIQNMLPAFKQLILEYKGSTTWIHVSFKDGSNGNQCLTIDAAVNKTLSKGSFVLIN